MMIPERSEPIIGFGVSLHHGERDEGEKGLK